LTVSELGRQYVPRRTSNRFGASLSGKYVLVLPWAMDPKTLQLV
jgi:hypothetical protein